MTPDRAERCCALCEHFTAKGWPEEAAQGRGRCVIFEKFVALIDPWCVLYAPAPHMNARKAWLLNYQQRQGATDGIPEEHPPAAGS